MDSTTLEYQEQTLVFDSFDESAALALGLALVDLARSGSLAVVINIRTANRTLFHAALPGAAPNNDQWARRKSNTVLLFQQSSLLVGTRMRAKPDTLERHGCDNADFSDSGGSFPIRVKGVGVVAAVTVSGLPQIDDHALVVRALTDHIGGTVRQ